MTEIFCLSKCHAGNNTLFTLEAVLL